MSINRHPSVRDLRWFAGLLIPFSGFIAWQCWRHGVQPPVCGSVVGFGSMVGLLGLVAPRLIRPVYVGWMIAVSPIAAVVTFTLMALVYYGVLWPIAKITRAQDRDVLKLKFDPQASTYWEEKTPVTDPRRYFRQY